jgi:CBS domain-containing protein
LSQQPQTAKDAKTDNTNTTRDASISDAARQMRDAEVAILAVVDDDDALIGVITDRDIAIVVADGLDPDTATVGDRMSDSPVSVGQNDDLETAFRRMVDNDVHRAPVTDDDRHVSGMLEQSDAHRHGEGRSAGRSQRRGDSA